MSRAAPITGMCANEARGADGAEAMNGTLWGLIAKWRRQVLRAKGSQDQWWIGMANAADELEAALAKLKPYLVDAKRANDSQVVPSKEVDDLLRHLEER